MALASLGLEKRDALGLVRRLDAGLSFSRVHRFSKATGLTVAEVVKTLQIPLRTLARRKARGALTRLESERLVRLARIFDLAVELWEGDAAAALAWLKKPAPALAGAPPLDMAKTEIGARAVEDLIGRLEFGVYF